MARKHLVIQGAKILFPNFSGRGSKYNPEGTRNFCILLDEELATRLANDGWTVRALPAGQNEAQQYSLRVAVSYAKRPPNIVMISNGRKQRLDQDRISILDWAEIENADVSIDPSYWELGGRSGIKAYLSSLFVTIVDDELERKYADIPEVPMSAPVERDNGPDDENLPF